MGTRRVVVAVTAVLLAVTAAPLTAAPLAAPMGEPRCVGRLSEQRGTTGLWTTVRVPGFATGSTEVSAHAVDPTDARRWWVTNGQELDRSEDGGCSWQAMFILPTTPTTELPVNRTTDRIARVAVPATQVGPQQVLLAVDVGQQSPLRGTVPRSGEDDAAAGASTLVLIGADRFRALAPLAAPAGEPGPLVVAPADGRMI